jgi:hypothetical protein
VKHKTIFDEKFLRRERKETGKLNFGMMAFAIVIAASCHKLAFVWTITLNLAIGRRYIIDRP